jgi:aspartyl-tRNA(Asn)/glutamyl-tRNA(Gln) amidotransferase subunit C
MPERLTEDQVQKVAKLARLRLSDAEVHDMSVKLSAVLDYIAKLNELDIENVEPMAHAMELSNVLREDVPTPGMAIEDVLANAPDQSPPFFKVPKVIGEASGA